MCIISGFPNINRCKYCVCPMLRSSNQNQNTFYLSTSINFSAMSWANAAGREDLMEKKMSSVVKYFLCSEHFTQGCFADPPFNTRLKKTIRPEVSIPIPTIFENNIEKYIPKNVPTDEMESYVNNCISFDGDNLSECYNCEVPSDVHFLDSEMSDIEHNVIAINGFIDEPSFVDVDALHSFSDSYDFIVEDNIVLKNQSNLPLTMDRSTGAAQPLENSMCRLCVAICPTNHELTQIASVGGLEAKIDMILPNLVSFDSSERSKSFSFHYILYLTSTDPLR